MRLSSLTLSLVSCVFTISCMGEGNDPNLLNDSAAMIDDNPYCATSGSCSSDHGHTTTWYRDSDGDGYGDHDHTSRSSSRPTGYVSGDTDCDDSDAAVHPDAVEICNGIDDDCNDLVDDADPGVTGQTIWHFDGDGDGYGIDTDVVESCYNPGGYADRGGDCNDESTLFHPGATEDDCTDPNDYNCDGTVAYADADGDGWPACEDCDDRDWHINPDAIEICDGVDNNCDTRIDDADPARAGGSTFYIDNDGDGYGTFAAITVACLVPDGYAALPGDCDDASDIYHPGAWEADCADPHDYNCDGSVAYEDADGDGWAACRECDDSDPAINPDAIEDCDHIDNNCDLVVDPPTSPHATTWYRDADCDGYGDPSVSQMACYQPYEYVADATDCDDGAYTSHPGAAEIYCDLADNNCDGIVDASVPTDIPFENAPLDSHAFPKFIDALTLPPFATPTSYDARGVAQYSITMTQFTQQLSSWFTHPTTVWGYNGTYPGPTFVVDSGVPIDVTYTNNLPPQQCLFPVDIDAVLPMGSLTPYTTVHLHGGHVPSAVDGGPMTFFTPDPSAPAMGMGPAGNSVMYEYPNNQPAATLWYHEHAMDATRINTYLGLAGLYLVRDTYESSLNLPSVATGQETAWVIQDRDFDSNYQLWYPKGPDLLGNGNPLSGLVGFPANTYSVVPEHFGNTILVNAVVWPYMNVQQGLKYRVHLLDGSSARTYALYLVPASQLYGAMTGFDATAAIPFYQIGTDQGLLAATKTLTSTIIMPGQRQDLVFDFTGVPMGDYILVNRAPEGMGTVGIDPPADINTTGQILKITVGPNTSGPDTTSLPMTPGSEFPVLSTADATVTRDISLSETTDIYGRLIQLVEGAGYMDPTTDFPVLGSTEIWQWLNTTVDNHPMHTHDEGFQVQGFQALLPDGAGGYLATVDTAAPFIPASDPVWGGMYNGELDTMIVPSGMMAQILIKFEDYTGDYVEHCHILEHEEHDMMRTFTVVP
jgi:spore coat protein A, manganese oxidase